MIVNKTRIFADANPRDMRGASMLEVLLALGVVTFLAPFVYKQITYTTHDIQDISAARNIIAVREAALNFVRMNQDRWPDYAQIKLAPDELAAISDAASAGFIDKYMVRGAAVTDVYLGFAGGDSDLRTSKIVRQIGTAAAMVGDDGVAYGDTWAVAAPDFQPGDLVYRISRDFSGEDKSKYLHRGTSGEDDLNVMMRDLDMGQFNVYDISTVRAQSAKVVDASTVFVTAEDMAASNVFFVAGRSEEHTSELQSQSVISYAVFCLKKIFFNDTATTEIYTICYTLSLHDALPICWEPRPGIPFMETPDCFPRSRRLPPRKSR